MLARGIGRSVNRGKTRLRPPPHRGDHVHWCPNGHCWPHTGPSALTCATPPEPDGDASARLDADGAACLVCFGGEAPIQGAHQHRCASCKGEWTHEGRCRGGRLAWCPWCMPEAVRQVPGTGRGPHQHVCPECGQTWRHAPPCTEPLRRVHAECAVRRSGGSRPTGLQAVRELPPRSVRRQHRRQRRIKRAARSPLVLVPVALALLGIVYRVSWNPPGTPGVPGRSTPTTWPTLALVPQERTPPVADSEAQGRNARPTLYSDAIPGSNPGHPDSLPAAVRTQEQREDARAAQPLTRGVPSQRQPPASLASSGRTAGTRTPAAVPKGGRGRIEPPPPPPVPPARLSVPQRPVVRAPFGPAGASAAAQPEGVGSPPGQPSPSRVSPAARTTLAPLMPVPPRAPMAPMGALDR